MYGFSKKVLDSTMTMCQDLIDLNRASGFSVSNNGLVGAAILAKGFMPVVRTSYKREDGNVVHGERAAIDAFKAMYGINPPKKSVLVCTLSPCDRDDMLDRVGCSCKDLVVEYDLRVYCATHDYFQRARIPNKAYGYPITFTGNKVIRQRAGVHRKLIRSVEFNNNNFKKRKKTG